MCTHGDVEERTTSDYAVVRKSCVGMRSGHVRTGFQLCIQYNVNHLETILAVII